MWSIGLSVNLIRSIIEESIDQVKDIFRIIRSFNIYNSCEKRRMATRTKKVLHNARSRSQTKLV
ncbi:hypothetical protein AAJ76_1590004677 [Vairimorpha ceranae]|uniref:Uncharacterized protein n=1 Tax=Vairimorpha ceranae TaxID=40302 RepID=A0A0F9WAK4_9MICR|nr:hypothetical protein AAJ76_1590004677 [Vairimorpha ceranae]KKO73960.1 hypothetical protein AAJ76_1590004677 [Vairimorpha ceranae]